MSTGAGCAFTEIAPGRWTYWLQNWPWGDNDDGETYGPFPSFSAAHTHLSDHHANPGGYSVKALPEGQHRHEWGPGTATVQVGFTVTVDVLSLGPDATREAVIERIQSLPADSSAWQLRPCYGDRPAIVCEACGKRKES